MKFLLIYKGDYGSALRGPELRYISLGKSLHEGGHTVQLAAKTFEAALHPPYIQFIRLRSFRDTARAFISTDCILLHGGGPVLIFTTLIAGLLGKKIILDNYVPHWIELDEEASHIQKSPKLLIKSSFNALRVLLGSLVFDALIVANQRQLDLARGSASPFTRTRDFNRTHIIPFGCDPYEPRNRTNGLALINGLILDAPKLQPDDFLVGWLGGTYGWFDLDRLLKSLAPAFRDNPQIKLIFFGVKDKKKSDLLNTIPVECHSNLYFLPWVDFNNRFDYWSAFDISLVWGADGYENDYASRTRNFDCLSLGLPILQNHDDEWGSRLRSSGAGVVTDLEHISQELIRLSRDKGAVQDMAFRMIQLNPEFQWSKFALTLSNVFSQPGVPLLRRLLGVLSFSFIVAASLILLVQEIIASFLRRGAK